MGLCPSALQPPSAQLRALRALPAGSPRRRLPLAPPLLAARQAFRRGLKRQQQAEMKMSNGPWYWMVICVAVLAGMVLHVRPSADPAEMSTNLKNVLPAVFYTPVSSTLLGRDPSR